MELLAEKMQQNPDAYHFETATEIAPETENPFDAAFRSKAALLGLEIHLRGNFYCKPPKLKQEKLLVRGQTALIAGETQTALDLLEDAVLSLLYAYDKETGTFRPATADDIEETFDSGELMAILSGALGMKFTETAAGN